MKKFLLSLIALATLCVSNAWGTVSPSVSGKTATFSGTGELSTTSSWRSTNSAITTVIVEENVTSIAADAFSGMTKITSVKLPSSLTSIGTDAFKNCSTIVKIYYADSPSKWAGITIANEDAHPFKGGSASDHDFYFYGNETTATTTLTLTPPLTIIKERAFYNSHFQYINIPGTVTDIKEKALYCTISGHCAINCRTAPNLGSSAITLGTSFYIPTGATGYNVSPWYSHTTNQAVSGTISDTYGAGISWVLDENGVLTLNATTENKAITFTGESAYNQYPWANFRRLVHKVVLQGEISELSQTFTYCWGISEVTLDQTTVPTFTTDKAKIAFGSLFNSRDDVVLKLGHASFADASASNLGSAPWNNARLDIQLSDNVVLSDNANNSTLVSNLQTYYAGKTFTLQLNRTLVGGGEQYNTFCSPIALTAAQLNDADIRALESSSLDDNVLTLTFSSSSLDNIVAGQPYLVKPSSELANPTFTNIAPNSLVSTTTNTETEYVDFIGVLAPTLLTGGDKNTLFLGADNELLWPEADASIKGMRAYFSVKGEAQQAAKRARIVMNKDAATGLQNTEHRTQTQKILRDGQIIIIRDGKEYNVQGQMIK